MKPIEICKHLGPEHIDSYYAELSGKEIRAVLKAGGSHSSTPKTALAPSSSPMPHGPVTVTVAVPPRSGTSVTFSVPLAYSNFFTVDPFPSSPPLSVVTVNGAGPLLSPGPSPRYTAVGFPENWKLTTVGCPTLTGSTVALSVILEIHGVKSTGMPSS